MLSLIQISLNWEWWFLRLESLILVLMSKLISDSFGGTGYLDIWKELVGRLWLFVFLIGCPAFIFFLAWELWKPSQGSTPSQRFQASLVTEGLKLGILLEKHFWGGWDVQVMVPATSATGCDKKWRARCLLPGYCGKSLPGFSRSSRVVVMNWLD